MRNILIIPKENISRYELEIARSGCCMSLAPISFSEDEGAYFIEKTNTAECTTYHYFDSSQNIMFDGYRLLLKYLRTICCSISYIENYLIPCEHISLDTGDIYIEGDRAVMQFSADRQGFSSSIKKLLEKIGEMYPETHADFLMSRLPHEFNAARLKKMIIAMELDLHYM